MTKTGARLRFDAQQVEVIVTKGGDASISIIDAEEQLKVGKRYECEATGMQVLVIRPGMGKLLCGNRQMTMQQPKTTKSAD